MVSEALISNVAYIKKKKKKIIHSLSPFLNNPKLNKNNFSPFSGNFFDTFRLISPFDR